MDVCVCTLMCVPALRKQTDIMKCVISYDVPGLLIAMQITRAPEPSLEVTFGLILSITLHTSSKCVCETSKQNPHAVSAQIK